MNANLEFLFEFVGHKSSTSHRWHVLLTAIPIYAIVLKKQERKIVQKGGEKKRRSLSTHTVCCFRTKTTRRNLPKRIIGIILIILY